MRSIRLGRFLDPVALLTVGVLLGGCGNPLTAIQGDDSGAQTRTVHATPRTLIALGPDREVKGAGANDHPATFNRLDMAYLLRDLRVRLDGSRQRGIFGRPGVHRAPLFTEATIKRLAKPLASAFGEAGPGQDVVVYVRQAPPKPPGDGTVNVGRYLDTKRISGVRLFVRDNKLYVIVGAMGINPNAQGDETGTNLGRGDLTVNRLKEVAPAGTRAQPRDKTAPLTGEFAQDREDQGRPDWLIVDYPRLLASVAGQRADGGSAALEAIDYQPTVGGGPPVESVEPTATERDPTARRETLERLRRDGIISEAEYQSRKRQLEAETSE